MCFLLILIESLLLKCWPNCPIHWVDIRMEHTVKASCHCGEIRCEIEEIADSRCLLNALGELDWLISSYDAEVKRFWKIYTLLFFIISLFSRAIGAKVLKEERLLSNGMWLGLLGAVLELDAPGRNEIEVMQSEAKESHEKVMFQKMLPVLLPSLVGNWIVWGRLCTW